MAWLNLGLFALTKAFESRIIRARGLKMKTIFLMAFLFLFLACAAFEPIAVREEKYGKSVPAIHQSFASTKLRPGDTWKVYLNASDADGDLKSIICTID